MRRSLTEVVYRRKRRQGIIRAQIANEVRYPTINRNNKKFI